MFGHETNNLVGYLEGGLSPEAHGRVERHLQGCARCREELSALRHARRALVATGQVMPAVQPDPELWARVRAEVAQPPRARPAPYRWSFAAGGAAVAAVFGIVALRATLDPFSLPVNAPERTASAPLDPRADSVPAPAMKSPKWKAPPEVPAARPGGPPMPGASAGPAASPAPGGPSGPPVPRRAGSETATDNVFGALSPSAASEPAPLALQRRQRGRPEESIAPYGGVAGLTSAPSSAGTRIESARPNALHELGDGIRITPGKAGADRARRMAKESPSQQPWFWDNGPKERGDNAGTAPAPSAAASAPALRAGVPVERDAGRGRADQKRGTTATSEDASSSYNYGREALTLESRTGDKALGVPAAPSLGTTTTDTRVLDAVTAPPAPKPDAAGKARAVLEGPEIVAKVPPADLMADRALAQEPVAETMKAVPRPDAAFGVRLQPNPMGNTAQPDNDALGYFEALRAYPPATDEGRRLYTRAGADYARGKTKEALAGYRKALEKGVTLSEARLAHMRLGDAAVRAKDDKAALAEYTAAVTIAKDFEVLSKLGGAYERLGEADKAINAYEQALIFRPNHPDVRKALTRLRAKPR